MLRGLSCDTNGIAPLTQVRQGEDEGEDEDEIMMMTTTIEEMVMVTIEQRPSRRFGNTLKFLGRGSRT